MIPIQISSLLIIRKKRES
ncbi:UNVERIFIED_CONTAM: hypothetical protein GTU68_006813 [Idotea baltica]|nr:hypothetical protein [Idotea baltica]